MQTPAQSSPGEELRTCTGCGETKPISEYWKAKRGRGGRSARCKSCGAAWYRANADRQLELQKARRAASREQVRRTQHAYYEANKDRKRDYDRGYRRARRDADPMVVKRAKLKHRYGITLEWYEELLQSQGGLCAICQGQLDAPRVDHCHATQQVRGLLCHHCNVGLGHFKDDIELLLRAAEYLRAHRTKESGC